MNEDSKDEHVKTVYAHFGLTQYLAQVLEHGLANALMYAELLPRRAEKPVPRKQWEAEFDGFMSQQFEQTLGRLIRGLGKATSVPTDLEGLLTDALKKRNFLAHHFFRERAESFMSSNGRDKMIEELEHAQKLFETADERLTEVAKPLRERYGITDEKLKPSEHEYLSKFENDL
ncbi:hypothetical protein [Metallibacterium scheffleri]|uniref:Uncharacterized protein n=1 Tax=Metallibacterium scheffleri TaxID=993689 RepID=A0A4S3KKF7_9GAMM|nr:hypothetical protein [Metallibacterium scheffleri]THD09312.1 hypothetical protein B1806_11310 [Metallibacterium scheffleri]